MSFKEDDLIATKIIRKRYFKMFYFMCKERLLISQEEYPNLDKVSENEAEKYKGRIFALNKLNPECHGEVFLFLMRIFCF